MGVLAALAGMIVTARLNSATPKAGDGVRARRDRRRLHRRRVDGGRNVAGSSAW
jgi:hypothetical protein